MPVLDHATHPSTVLPANYRHGCFNREVKGWYLAPDGYRILDAERNEDGEWVVEAAPRFTRVSNTMSRECRYDKSLTDPACDGCKWRGFGERYAEMIRGEGE